MIFKSCFENGILSTEWKEKNVALIHTKKDKQ